MLIVYLGLVFSLMLAAESSKSNLIVSDGTGKQRTKSRSKRALDLLSSKDANDFSRLEDSPNSAPVKKSFSDVLPRRDPKPAETSVKRKRGPRPRSYDPEMTDPTDPLLFLIEPRPRKMSSGCSPAPKEEKQPLDRVFGGLTKEQLEWVMVERHLNYLDAKAEYARAKLEYHQIKHYIATHQP